MSETPYFTTPILAKLYDVSEQTIRNWVDEFSNHFSPTARPNRGRHLKFTREDVGVLSKIAELRDMRESTETISNALGRGERGPIPDASPEELKALTLAEQNRALQLRIDFMQLKIEDLVVQAERTRKLELEVAGLQAQLELIQSQPQPDVADLYKEIGALQAKLEMAEAEIKRLKKE